MSFSKPFFGDKATYRKKQLTGYDDDTEFNTLHWTEQLKRRPLRDRFRREYPKGDFDIRLDNWDTPEEYDNNDKEIK